MKEGTASHTARSVAARRLQYERVPVPYGDPAADEALSDDVADGLAPAPGPMHEYLRARTAFFDRVVVTALGRGVRQVVNGGAGYDGRALRYAKPGVRWFEVDHPATQADKRERIARLGLATPGLSFIPADFSADPLAEPLLAAGLDPGRAALFLLEGVVVYLDRPAIERVLAQFRAVTPVASVLAVSVSIENATSQARARFQQRVAQAGEPARTVLTFGQAETLLAGAGWKPRQPAGRQRAAGLLLAHAATVPSQSQRQRVAPPDPVPRPATPAPARQRSSCPASAAAMARVPEPPADLPLSALMSQALVAFTIEVDNETEHRLPHRTQRWGREAGSPAGAPWLTSMLMYANCLRHVPDAGITIAELRARARTGTNLDGMRRWGYVTYRPDPGPGKAPGPDALIRPTSWGIEARDTWREVTAAVESRWCGRLGEEQFAALRAALTGLVGHLDPALPDCLPILGYGLQAKRALGSETGGAAAAGALSAAEAAAAAGDLPVWALLSRPLIAFAAQYEAEPGPSLAVGADILRVLPDDGVHTKDIPALGGVSKESVAMAMGVLSKSGLVTEGPGPDGSRFRFTRLTAGGVVARDEYPALAADIERDWGTRFGAATVSAVRRALAPLAAGSPPRLFAGLTPYPDNWRARVPPPATLPHFPMTLHRGGYPDGS